jgi:predicted transcriptional regulator
MISGRQMKAARALLDMDQRTLSELSGVSLATIRRMEASSGTVRSNVDTLVKIVETLEREGVLLIADGVDSFGGGRGVRLRG